METPKNQPLNRSSLPHLPGDDCQFSLDAAALDLVRAATDEGDDAVIRTLLRTSVALGLTSAATYWTVIDEGTEAPSWSQRRGFGGTTPAPSLPVPRLATPGLAAPRLAAARGAEDEPSDVANYASPGLARTIRLGEHGAIVTLRESFDRDGRREVREEELETLVLLAETLLLGETEIFGAAGPPAESLDGVPGPLPNVMPDAENRRQAG